MERRKKLRLKDDPLYVAGFSKLVRFMYLLKDFNLSPEETNLMIWRFMNNATYDTCAKMVGRGYSKQCAAEKVGSVLRKIRTKLLKRGKLVQFKELLLEFQS